MKKFFFISFFFSTLYLLKAQVPQGISYQAVVRDANGNVIANQQVQFRFTILQDAYNGQAVFQEVQNTTTNSLGIANLTIGYGVQYIGNISEIDWGNHSHYLRVEIDPQANNNFTELGVTQLVSVPYALYANICGNAVTYTAGNGIDITNGVITNIAPDQIVTLNAGSGVSITGTYPNYTINNIAPDQSITLNAGNGINITGTYPSYTIQHVPHTGDVSGTTALTVTGIQNRAISSTTPSTGQVLRFDGTQWVPANASSVITAGSGLLYSDNTLNSVWSINGNHIYNNNNGNVGIGILNPSAKLSITDTSNLIFQIKDKLGRPVFEVYQDSVKIYISSGPAKVNKGAFVINPKMDSGKQGETNYSYFTVTPDSTQITTENPDGGFSVNDTSNNISNYMNITPENYFIGHEAGKNNISGKYNIFLGYNSGFKNQTGYFNVFLGNKTGYESINSNYCTFLGFEAGKINNSSDNTFIGYTAGQNHISGGGNVFIGSKAGQNDSIGAVNVFIGELAGYSNKTGSNNIFLGFGTGAYNVSGFQNIFLGNYSGMHNKNGNKNIFIGTYCGYLNENGQNNIFIGTQSGMNNLSGNYNVFIGDNCGYSHKKGNSNIYIGYECGLWSDSSKYNVGIGVQTLRSNTKGECNVAIGYEALYRNNGFANTALGYRSLISLDSSMYNIAIGPLSAWHLKVGSNNVIIGSWAYANNDSCFSTVCIGSGAMYYSEGKNNVAIGPSSLYYNVGDENTAIGTNAFLSYSQSFYENSTAIGANTQITASNQIRLGNSNILSIGGYQPWSNLSDKRFKKDVSENVPGLNFIMKLRPVTYKLNVEELNNFLNIPDSLRNKKNEKIRSEIIETGFIAQEVEEAAKQLGFEFSGIDKPKNDKDFYSLRYSTFVVPIVKAIQEQQNIIENQQKKMELQQKEIEKLKEEIQILKNKLK